MVMTHVNLYFIGAWRSLVAYLNGVQRAGGSNPLAPTIFNFLEYLYFQYLSTDAAKSVSNR